MKNNKAKRIFQKRKNIKCGRRDLNPRSSAREADVLTRLDYGRIFYILNFLFIAILKMRAIKIIIKLINIDSII